MAISLASLVVDLTANTASFARDMKRATGHMGSFAKSATSVANIAKAFAGFFVIREIAGFLGDTVKAAQESENAITLLNQSLANQNRFSREASISLQQYATSLQNVTGISDEAILGGQAFLISMGLQGKALETATKQSLDFSVGMKKGVQESFVVVGKAAVGNVTALQKLGFQFTEHASKAQHAAEATAQMARFLGNAEAQGRTFSGRMNIMKANFNDLEEAIGKGLILNLTTFTGLLTNANGAMATAAGMTKFWAQAFSLPTKAMIAMGIGIGSLLEAVMMLGEGLLRFVVRPLNWMVDTLSHGTTNFVGMTDAAIESLAKLRTANENKIKNMMDNWSKLNKTIAMAGEMATPINQQLVPAIVATGDSLAKARMEAAQLQVLLAEMGGPSADAWRTNFQLPFGAGTKIGGPAKESGRLTKGLFGEGTMGAGGGMFPTSVGAPGGGMLGRLAPDLANMAKQADAAFAQMSNRAKTFAVDFRGIMTGAFSSIGNLFADLVSGQGDPLGKFFAGLLGTVGEFAISLGSTMVAMGFALTALYTLNPAALIGFGAALVVAGGLIKGFSSKLGGSASGASFQSGIAHPTAGGPAQPVSFNVNPQQGAASVSSGSSRLEAAISRIIAARPGDVFIAGTKDPNAIDALGTALRSPANAMALSPA